jgi:hypothetical protein
VKALTQELRTAEADAIQWNADETRIRKIAVLHPLV